MNLGALVFHGTFAGKQAEAVPWAATSAASFKGGLSGTGPIVLFSQDSAVVISFASSFMAGNYAYNKLANSVDFGIAGGVTSIPKGFKISTILSSQGDGKLTPLLGVRDMMKDWGRKLMALYELRRRGRKENDFTATYLSYSTDVRSPEGEYMMDIELVVFRTGHFTTTRLKSTSLTSKRLLTLRRTPSAEAFLTETGRCTQDL